MQKLPEARPESASAVARRIDAILHPTPQPEPEGWNLREWLGRDSVVLGLRLPRWALLLPAAVFIGIWVIGLFVSPDPGPIAALSPEAPSSQASAVPNAAVTSLPDPNRLPKLISQAEFGEVSALTELRAIAPEKRDREVWVVIGQGLKKASMPGEAVKELANAVRHEPELANDEGFTSVIRELASSDDSAAALEALTLAATELGPRGVDVLFSVWSETKHRTPATALAERYLDDKEVLKHASKPILVALELRKPDLTCERVKELLEQAKSYGDTRSLRPMAKFRKVRGCGPKKRSDCYECIRGSELLDEAVREANSRTAPRY